MEPTEKSSKYSKTPPYSHLGNTITLLLRPLFLAARQNGHTFSCKKPSLIRPYFFLPLVTILTGFHYIQEWGMKFGGPNPLGNCSTIMLFEVCNHNCSHYNGKLLVSAQKAVRYNVNITQLLLLESTDFWPGLPICQTKPKRCRKYYYFKIYCSVWKPSVSKWLSLIHVHVVVNFLSQVILVFPLFLGMVM